MTEEEQLIYNYLYENYDYQEDGNLVRKFDAPTNRGIKKGKKLGSFFYQTDASPRLRATLNINGTNYTKNLSHLIYLYFNKTFPDILEYIDNNPTNCRIENLKVGCRVTMQSQSKRRIKGYTSFRTKDGKMRYKIVLHIGRTKTLTFGSSDSPEEARKVYDFAKKLYIEDKTNPDEIKQLVMQEFPNIQMKMGISNKHGYEKIYQRGERFVARHNGMSSTHDTPEEAYQDVLRMKNGEFQRTNRLKTSHACTKPGCDKPYEAKGLCVNHYTQHRRAQNKRIRPNKTGFPGVKKDRDRYSARYNRQHLGMFDSAEEAHQAYLNAKNKNI